MLEAFLKYLRSAFADKRALILVSGGLDSTVLAHCFKLAGLTFGLFYGDSPIRPIRFRLKVEQLALKLKTDLKIAATEELKDHHFLEDPLTRCYYCKLSLLKKAVENMAAGGWTVLIDGTNKSDLADFRPGLRALEEFMVRSPWLEYGLGKEEILEIRKELGLNIDTAATTCLATRFIDAEHPVEPALFKYLEEQESHLKSIGFENVRIRVLKKSLLLQVAHKQVPRLSKVKKLIKYPLGYSLKVDPAGYRSAGSILMERKKIQ
jgi:uncharacterized protein